MTKFSKPIFFSIILIMTSLILNAGDNKPKYGLQVEKKLESKLKKYATECTVDIIQDIVPTDANGNGSRLKDKMKNPDRIKKDSKSYNYGTFLKSRGQVKKQVRSSMRANENHHNLPQFIKRQPDLGLLGDRELDNLLDRIGRESVAPKRIVRYRKLKKIVSTKRVHGTTLEGRLISIKRKEHTKVQKEGTFQKPRSIGKSVPRLGRMLSHHETKLPQMLSRSSASFSRSHIIKSPGYALPKDTDATNHCK